MSGFASLLLIALFAERLVEAVKALLAPWLDRWPVAYREAVWRLLGLGWGLVLALGLKVNLFLMVGLPEGNPVLGALLAGLFAGMGTEWVHQLLTNLPRLSAEARRIRVLGPTRDGRPD